jgi:hypothetical protein
VGFQNHGLALLLYCFNRDKPHGLPEGSWINVWDMAPQQAVDHVMCLMDGPNLSKQTAAAFQEAQSSLFLRFNDTGLWLAERARLAQALPNALQDVLDQASSVSR